MVFCFLILLSMKWMDRPGVTEMDTGGVYEMDRPTKWKKNGNATDIDNFFTIV